MERIAVALNGVGARVLHCDAPRSVLRRPDTRLHELAGNLFTFTPVILGTRLNWFSLLRRTQAEAIVRQIVRHAQALGLRDPMFLYPYAGLFALPVRKAMESRGFPLVHVSLDYWEEGEQEYVGPSSLTLAIPRTVAHRLRARWGRKIHQIPQGADLRPFQGLRADAQHAPPLLAPIPRPRLGYTGAGASGRLDTRILTELLARRPDWSFVSFGKVPAVPLPNAHVLPWQSQEGLARCVAAFDVGFMPYDCSNVGQFNCVPMKLFDYFALGLPVVATPIIHLWEYEGLVYFGETAEELERAVEAALEEPVDSPKRRKRREVAEAHSIEALGRALSGILD